MGLPVSVKANPSARVPDAAQRFPYRPDIDGLRGIAVLAVVFYHAFPSRLRGGFVGVDIFFVISGYLISGIISHGLRTGSFTFRHFYAGRIRRIFPALIATLCVVLAIGKFVLIGDEIRLLQKHVAGGSAFLSNFVLWSEAGYFDVVGASKPLLHLWSLGVEEQFYLLWPIALFLAWKRSRAGLLCLAVIAFSFALNLWWSYTAPDAAFYLCAARFWELLLGAALVIEPRVADPVPLALRAPLGLVLVVLAFWWILPGSRFPGYAALLPTMGAGLLIAAGPDAWINRRVLGSSSLVWIGLISYPLYLFHWPLFSFAFIVQSDHPSTSIQLAIIPLAVLLSWLAYRFLEKPIRFGQPRPSVIVTLCLLLPLVGLAGLRAELSTDPHATPDAQALMDQMQWTYVRSAGCGQYSLKTADCILTGARPVISLMGDSHAMALAVGLSRVLDTAVPLVYLGNGGCPALMGAISQYQNQGVRCAGFSYEPAQIAEAVGSSRLVILTSRDAWYLTTEDWHLEANGILGDKKAIFATAYSRTISVIEKLGPRVVLMIDVPDVGFPPTDCVDLRPVRLTAFQPRNPCGVEYRKHREYTSGARDLVMRLKREHPNLIVFDPTGLFCDGSWCYATRDGKFLYRDGDHLSVNGAEYVARKLIDSLPAPVRAEVGLSDVPR